MSLTHVLHYGMNAGYLLVHVPWGKSYPTHNQSPTDVILASQS